MLVVRRRVGEILLVGDGTEIEVLDVIGKRVKLGIRGPGDLTIQRKEVALAREENRTASLTAQGKAAAARLASLLHPPEPGPGDAE